MQGLPNVGVLTIGLHVRKRRWPVILHGLGRFADHRSGLTVPGINDLFLDQPLAIHLDAGVDITAHGADGFVIPSVSHRMETQYEVTR